MKALKRNKKFYGIVLSILVVILLIVLGVSSIAAPGRLCCYELQDCAGAACCDEDGDQDMCRIICPKGINAKCAPNL